MFDGLYKLARDEGPAELYRELRRVLGKCHPPITFAYEILKGLSA